MRMHNVSYNFILICVYETKYAIIMKSNNLFSFNIRFKYKPSSESTYFLHYYLQLFCKKKG